MALLLWLRSALARFAWRAILALRPAFSLNRFNGSDLGCGFDGNDRRKRVVDRIHAGHMLVVRTLVSVPLAIPASAASTTTPVAVSALPVLAGIRFDVQGRHVFSLDGLVYQ